MQKPLDPLSVDKAKTPSASYVLRRRYAPVRYVVAVAGWVTAINLLLQPVAVLAAEYVWDHAGATTGSKNWSDPASWSGDPDPVPTFVAGDTLDLFTGVTLTGAGTVLLDTAGDVTLAVIDMRQSPETSNLPGWTINRSGSQRFIMDNGASAAEIKKSQNSLCTVTVPLLLNSSLDFVNGGGNPSRVISLTETISANTSGTKTITAKGNSSGGVTLGGIISDGSGVIQIVNTLATPLTLSGNNSFSGGVINKSGTVIIGHDSALGTGTFQIGDSAGTTAVTLNAATADRTINNALTIYQNFTYTGTYNLSQGTGAITLYKAPTITVTAKTLTVGGLIDDGASDYGLTKAGAGNLVLTNTGNTFGNASAISVSAGALYIAGDGALGAANNTITVSGTGGIGYSTAGTYNITDNESFAGRTVTTTTYGWAAGDGVTMNLNEAMTGNKAVNIFGYGTGKVVSTVANSHSTTVSVNPGATYELQDAGGMGSNTVGVRIFGAAGPPVTYATLNLRGDVDTDFVRGVAAQRATIDVGPLTPGTTGKIMRVGDITDTMASGGNDGLRILKITGSSGYGLSVGAISSGKDKIYIYNEVSGGLTIRGDIGTFSQGGDLYIYATNSDVLLKGDFKGNAVDWLGAGIGAGSLVKEGAYTLKIEGTGNAIGYTGKTTINAGVLEVAKLDNGGNASSIGKSPNDAANLVFGAPTATLKYSGSSNATTDRGFTMSGGTGGGATLDASGAGSITFDNTVAIAYGTANQTRVLTLTGTSTAANEFGKVLANNGTGKSSLVKSGTGLWKLTGANTYTGATDVNLGTLLVKGSLTSRVTVNSGGTLGGTGTITGNVGFEAGSAMQVEATDSPDYLKVTGWVDLTGSPTLAIVGNLTGETTVLTATSGITGEFAVPEGYVIRYTPDEAPTTVKIEKPTGRLFIVR